jgi:hypothetical protein
LRLAPEQLDSARFKRCYEDGTRPLGEPITHAHVTRIEADLCLGRHRDLIDELTQLSETQPGNEHLIRLLVLATYRDSGGEAAAAICHDRLAYLRSMGIVAPKLTDLQTAVLKRSPELDLVPQRIFEVPRHIRAFTCGEGVPSSLGTPSLGQGRWRLPVIRTGTRCMWSSWT